MGVVFSGTKVPQSELKAIQHELYADFGTFREKDIDIQEGHKSGAEVYESKVTVTPKPYTGGAVTAGSDVLAVQRSVVNLTKIEFSDTVKYDSLLDTRFEKSMKKGAFNVVSQEFDNAILQFITPAIGQTMEEIVWTGATTAQKALIAGLTPGAGQGSISASAQVIAAAMPTNLINSLPAIILHNDSLSKDTPGAGIGDYVKVAGTPYTAATIAAEYAKMYAAIEPKVLNDKVNPPVIYAPLADRQLMRTANNSVGAASNQNFLFSSPAMDAKAFYNGVEVKFKPLPTDFAIISPSVYLKILFDLKNDMNILETGKMPAGSDEYYYKNVQAMAAWVTNQRYIILYGG